MEKVFESNKKTNLNLLFLNFKSMIYINPKINGNYLFEILQNKCFKIKIICCVKNKWIYIAILRHNIFS